MVSGRYPGNVFSAANIADLWQRRRERVLGAGKRFKRFKKLKRFKGLKKSARRSKAKDGSKGSSVLLFFIRLL